MFCTNCGTRNEDSATNCKHCGLELRRPSFGSVGMEPPPPPQAVPPAPQAPPPTYQAPISQAAQPPVYGVTPQVPNYIVQAILTMLCCCLPFGVVSLVYAIQVNSHLAAGNVAAAMESSKNAKMWAWIAFFCGIVPAGIWFFFAGLGMLGSLSGIH